MAKNDVDIFFLDLKETIMVVGYALGNRGANEEDIRVLGEDDLATVSYSRSLAVCLSRSCPVTGQVNRYVKRDLSVPYSTIRGAQDARAKGIREIIYYSIDRPDMSSRVRSMLNLWGFDNYLKYLYTVCELGLLEGVIPVISLGFLTPQEITVLSEVVAVLMVAFEKTLDWESRSAPSKLSEEVALSRLKNARWSARLGLPVSLGLVVTTKNSFDRHKDAIVEFNEIHKLYGMVHNVVVQPYDGVSQEYFFQVVEKIREHLDGDIVINVPLSDFLRNPDGYLGLGFTDLGSIVEDSFAAFAPDKVNYQELIDLFKERGKFLQQRFPLRYSFIKNESYSKKLGQVFDSYRYKLKKANQEKGATDKVISKKDKGSC